MTTEPTTGSTAIPDTPAGRQLTWLLETTATSPTLDAAMVNEHFDEAFLQQVPPEELVRTVQGLIPAGGLTLTEVQPVSPTQITGLAETTQGLLSLGLQTGPDGLIAGLVFRPPPTQAAVPSSWSELDQRLKKLVPQTSMLTAKVAADGQCQPVHALDAEAPRPLGSIFKLYVLGAVATQVAAGDLTWDDELRITADVKSLPSGELQDQPDGSAVSVRDAAEKMISISDNTAADLLAERVGRAAVETAQTELGSTHAELNSPFLRTRELFALKGSQYPQRRDTYLGLPADERLGYLESTVAAVPLSEISDWTAPRDVDTLEWLASPQDVCRAYGSLDQLAADPALTPLATIMSTNDGGLNLAPDEWPSVWFKGGSEPGVLTVSWRAKTTDGASFVTVLMTQNPTQPLDETTALLELLALAKGSFTLARET